MGNDTGHQQDEVQEATGGCATVHLGSSLDITVVADVQTRLRQALDAGSGIALDGGGLDRVDGAGLQLLAAFAKHARDANIPVNWCAVSPCLEQSAHLCGLGSCLGLPAVCTS